MYFAIILILVSRLKIMILQHDIKLMKASLETTEWIYFLLGFYPPPSSNIQIASASGSSYPLII